ncbi:MULTISPECIES: response regulator [unclassified Fusibacter]|uniref:response regulator n=1 Tax=unclassified Fusibacter TaxID=2624464 RepID=UPI0010109684|nr:MULTISPECIES: response regulator [unclassified Fusibacter]MCK8060407.1 response regulator [Fusibacter sp. A2]NPE20304.1 response regulator [Fusibacter sp. A1]RXV63510.1 response regulator [Fusibacter sp. A1]
MRILIAEDDLVSRRFLQKLLNEYGDCDLVIDGIEAIDAFMMSLRLEEYYDLICLDIMMPRVDGIKVLKTMRDLEEKLNVKSEHKAKIVMTTALGETDIVKQAFEYGCDAYASKPIDTQKLLEVMYNLNLIKNSII